MTDPTDPYAVPSDSHPQEHPTQPLPYQQHQTSAPSAPYPQAPAAPGYGQPGPGQPGHPGYYQQGHPAYPPGYAYPQYVVRPPTNGLAIAALVLGILWLYWIGSILALVFGYVALNQIRNASPEAPQEGRGLALAGIVLGWVGTATIVVPVLIIAGLAASGY